MSNSQSADWLLATTSTLYMSGKAVYHLRRYGQPGIIASIELSPADAVAFRQSLQEHDDQIRAEAWREGYDRAWADHCDYYPTIAECDAFSPNPYRQHSGELTSDASP